ncbi:HAD-IIIA family hydrolase [Nocardioides sp. URHA0020]|uniref:HAD-IIIA family hydrolase n=1 Tax=Nocardioides sp. URHA0020 TaxID=1380392 RepID=UPI00048B3C95|nr:HAD-IIIA family hydrolase [Nocardioides sp. URHA0020]
MSLPQTTLVIPTLGRPSLVVLLRALADQTVPLRSPVVLVDDRPSGTDLAEVLDHELGHDHGLELLVLRAGGGGPARARNLGWRHARTTWVSFLDDDVVPPDSWYADLAADLGAAELAAAAGSVGRVHVPLPPDRAPTDWERGTAGLETARWITADLTYRRSALSAVGGFDERFPRAFREDADLALRLGAERGRVVDGARRVTHPVRPAGDWASLRQQAGNADDFLMRALHGRHWHRRAQAPVGRRARNAAITALGLVALGAECARRRPLAVGAAAAWAAGSLELAWARIAPGPRDRAEVRRMLLTSIAIPPAATFHSLRGLVRHRGARPWRGLPDLVLLDRDGTLVEDVPYNGDPTLVRPMPGAAEALSRVRALGVRTALVTNQSGIASGRISRAQADAVNARVEELLGPFDAIYLCPHAAADGCDCRKPEPGMVKQACLDLGVDAARTVLIGDIGSDVAAAEAAGAVGILVPTGATLGAEVAAAGLVEPSVDGAVDRILAGAW